MGWANCGNDSEGRPIGYAHEAICDHPRCNTEIDRGLAYACGGMHGENGFDCAKYFCDEHLYWVDADNKDILSGRLCASCKKLYENTIAAEQKELIDYIDDGI